MILGALPKDSRGDDPKFQSVRTEREPGKN